LSVTEFETLEHYLDFFASQGRHSKGSERTKPTQFSIKPEAMHEELNGISKGRLIPTPEMNSVKNGHVYGEIFDQPCGMWYVDKL